MTNKIIMTKHSGSYSSSEKLAVISSSEAIWWSVMFYTTAKHRLILSLMTKSKLMSKRLSDVPTLKVTK